MTPTKQQMKKVKLKRSVVHKHKFTHEEWGMNGRYGKRWLQKTQDWLLKSWNEMFCAEAKATWIDASRCVGWPVRVRQNGKVSLWQLQKCTARKISADGFSSEESVTCLVVPCSPQRALPLAGKAGRRKKKKRQMCAWASSVEAVTFCLRPWKTFMSCYLNWTMSFSKHTFSTPHSEKKKKHFHSCRVSYSFCQGGQGGQLSSLHVSLSSSGGCMEKQQGWVQKQGRSGMSGSENVSWREAECYISPKIHLCFSQIFTK